MLLQALRVTQGRFLPGLEQGLALEAGPFLKSGDVVQGKLL
nr:hypothetical protein [Allomeiothermus silvanus]